MQERTARFLAGPRARTAIGALLGWTVAVMVAAVLYPPRTGILVRPEPNWCLLIVVPLLGILAGAMIGRRWPSGRAGRRVARLDIAAHAARATLFAVVGWIAVYGAFLHVGLLTFATSP